MRKFKRLTLTLALLLTAVGGAWAQDTYNVTFKANNKTTTVENVTLPKTFQCSYNNADGDLDLILKELYGWTGDSSETICANWSTPKSSDANKVVAGKNGNDHYITIDNVFEGTVTITGDYIVDLELTQYSLEISIAEPTEWSLTPDETGKTWTLYKMPASNIELQVEYFAESNLFLSKEALADKTSIAVKAGDLGVQFGDDGKSENTVTEGNTVTAKFTGKKVLGMTVKKKAAVLLNNTITAWTTDTYAVPAGGLTYSDAITVSGDVTLVLTDGETLTLNKGISLASGATLTIQGNGTMAVNGTNENKTSTVAGSTGTLILTSGTLTATGGNGLGVDEDEMLTDNRAYAGGNAINGNVTVSGGTLTAIGGNGGSIGNYSESAYGADGGVAISGSVTVTDGTVTATGGNGGSIGVDASGAKGGSGGAAIGGDATVNGGTWTASNGTNGGGDGGKAVAGTVTDNR